MYHSMNEYICMCLVVNVMFTYVIILGCFKNVFETLSSKLLTKIETFFSLSISQNNTQQSNVIHPSNRGQKATRNSRVESYEKKF